jgi:hypothetical protein
MGIWNAWKQIVNKLTDFVRKILYALTIIRKGEKARIF